MREVLLSKPYSDHPGDSYLSIVLCRYNGKYVTWTFNSVDGGYSSGHYFTSPVDAAVDWLKRPN